MPAFPLCCVSRELPVRSLTAALTCPAARAPLLNVMLGVPKVKRDESEAGIAWKGFEGMGERVSPTPCALREADQRPQQPLEAVSRTIRVCRPELHFGVFATSVLAFA